MPSYICATCGLDCPTYNTLIEHGVKVHADKVVDPGNEFSSPGAKKLVDLIAWVRRAPDANLKTGEGALLLAEIDRLAAELLIARQPCGNVLCPNSAVEQVKIWRSENPL